MTAQPRVDAVFPGVPRSRGHYESFYLRAVHPSEALGVWIRYTIHKRPGAAPRGSLWFTLFDPGGGPKASKVTVDDPQVPEGGYIRIGDGVFEPGHAAGRATSDQCDASWDLRIEPTAEPFRHLPGEWMYRRRLPKTKTESPVPAARVTGTVEVDGREIALDRWLGMMGHNWGAQHAERWVWVHGIGFDDHPDAWLDAAVGRVKVGPAVTPWIGNGCLHLDGSSYRLGGLGAVRATEVDPHPERCELRLPGVGITVVADVGSQRRNFVGWRYADPDGGEHHTLNCSVARMGLVVHLENDRVIELRTAHGAAYEQGTRDTDHGVPIQPFPDG